MYVVIFTTQVYVCCDFGDHKCVVFGISDLSFSGFQVLGAHTYTIYNQVKKLFAFLIVWAGAKQSRSPGAEQPTQVWVYQLPVGVDGLASLA